MNFGKNSFDECYERLNKKGHKTRTEIEPASSDNRSAALLFKLSDHHLESEYDRSNKEFKIKQGCQRCAELDMNLSKWINIDTSPSHPRK